MPRTPTPPEQTELFATPKAKPLRRPALSGGAGKATYSKYKVKTPVSCDHCQQVVYEDLMAKRPAGMPRQAHVKRRQGGKTELLCHEHAKLAKEHDKEASNG